MNEQEGPSTMTFSRRNVLVAGAFGASAVVLSACSKAATPGAATGTTTTPGTATAGSTIAKLSDINVGEAVSVTGTGGSQLIVARPTSTTVAAFSAVCTHQGCTVAPAGKRLDCPCHGSLFDATTGEVLRGPASRALDKVNVALSGNNIVAG
jgi:Rieske Fe-S protein